MLVSPESNVLWLEDRPTLEQGRLPASCDTVVVGAGIAGTWLALELQRAGLEVLLLDGAQAAAGSSGRNAGQLIADLPWAYAEAIRRLGRDLARQWRELLVLNQQWLDAELADCRSEVQFMRTGSLSCAADDAERKLLELSARRLVEDGFPVEFWTAEQLQKRLGVSPFHGALYQPEDATLHPARLVWALLGKFQRAGGRYRGDTRVQTATQMQDGWSVELANGTVACRRIIWCLNGGLADCLPELVNVIQPARAQILLGGRERKVFAMPMASNRGQEYWRQAEKGEVLIGGMRRFADPAHADRELDPLVDERLRQFGSETFPKLAGVEFTGGWTGLLALTTDERPLVGPRPGFSGQFVCGGWNGCGVGQAIVFGRLLAGEILAGEPDARLDAFRPARFDG